jgi:hypothetical protein
MLTAMALAAAGFGQSPRLVRLGGLFQRASIDLLDSGVGDRGDPVDAPGAARAGGQADRALLPSRG